MFNFNKKPSDTEIIRAFYAPIVEAMKKDSTKNINAQTLNQEWQSYLDSLDPSLKERAKELSYVVTHEAQTVPQAFNFTDITKAVFMLITPDLLSQHYFGISLCSNNGTERRVDDLFKMINAKKKEEGGYTIAPNYDYDEQYSPEITGSFENFVVEREIELGENSVLYPFEKFFNENKRLDRYTQQKFSLMLLDATETIAKQLFIDNHLIGGAVRIGLLNFEIYIEVLRNMMGDFITAYVWKKKIKNSTIESIDSVRYLQEQNHISAARSTCLTSIKEPPSALAPPEPVSLNSMVNVLKKNRQHSLLTISLGVAPAITGSEKDLQKSTYPVEASSRSGFYSNDPWDHDQARPLLGLEPEEDYRRFICDDYTISESSFTLPERRMLDNHFFANFLACNIDFLKQINKNRCTKKIYPIIISRLWAAYLDDQGCPSAIKKQYKNSDPMTMSSDGSQSRSNPANLIIEMTRCLFYPNRKKYYSDTDQLLTLLQQLAKNSNDPLFPTVMAAIADPLSHILKQLICSKSPRNHQLYRDFIDFLSKNSPATDSDDAEIVLLDKKIQTLQNTKLTLFSARKSNGLVAMRNVLACSYFSKDQRLELHDLIAKKHHASMPIRMLSTKHQFYKKRVEERKKRKKAEVVEAIQDENNMPALISMYKKNPHDCREPIKERIDALCTKEKLRELRQDLKAILPTLCVNQSYFSFYQTEDQKKEKIFRNTIAYVIHVIEQDEPAIEVLLTLRQAGRNSKKKFADDNLCQAAVFCRAIDEFFYAPKKANDDKIIEGLLNTIKQIVPEQTTESRYTQHATFWPCLNSISPGANYLATLFGRTNRL